MEFSEKAVVAGTDKKGDVRLTLEVFPNQSENKIVIESKVLAKYGKQIELVINKMLEQYKLAGVYLHAIDQGAFDFTWKARLETAILRWQTKVVSK